MSLQDVRITHDGRIEASESVPAGFSLNPEMILKIFNHAQPLGHHQNMETLNLGFGFLYYSMVRVLRPKYILVIGSGFGFSVACLALGLRDNMEGTVGFVDPSYSLLKHGPFKTVGGCNTWGDPEAVRNRFALFGVQDIVTHYKMTSQDFFPQYETLHLPKIDIAFIDGNHSFESVKYDFISIMRHVRKNSLIFLHDTHIYVREWIRNAGVKRWLTLLKGKGSDFEVLNLPYASGVALVRVLKEDSWKSLAF